MLMETNMITKTDLLVREIADNTSDAYMAASYGDDRWTQNIRELIDYGYTEETVEWIVRSKIARWADDYEMSMLAYIQKHVGDVKLREWIRGE